MKTIFFCMFFTIVTTSLLARTGKEKNIPYLDRSLSYFNGERHILDVYFPKDTATKKGVFVFFHGGSWKGGKKNTYRFIARTMAKKGFVAVLVNYRLAPEVLYDQMGEDCAHAIHWVHQNIARYGGDRDKITVAGHSAGGHLAAYIALGNTFEKLDMKNPIAKTILIDAFGLDMPGYFSEYDNPYSRSLFDVFTSNPEQWRSASPFYHIKPGVSIPFLVLAGGRTFETIMESNKKFYLRLKEKGVRCDYHVIHRKKHIGMVTQLLFRNSKVYGIMLEFMDQPYRNGSQAGL